MIQNVTGDISLYVTKDKTKYCKVSPNKDVSVGKVLSDDQIVCYFEDKRYYFAFWPVTCEKVQVGMVYGDVEDTARTVKLRIQDQLGIPASHVSISKEKRVEERLHDLFRPRSKSFYNVPDSETMSCSDAMEILVLPYGMQGSEK